MYQVAVVCTLFLQLVVYSASYYVTQAITLKKLHPSFHSPLASIKNHLFLLVLSLGSFLAIYYGLYLPVILTTLVIVIAGAYSWFTD